MRESLLRMTALTLLVLLLQVVAATAGERVALVIGNNAYQHGGSLNNAVSDAQTVGNALQALGFRVIRKQDLDYGGLLDALDELGKAAAGADWAVVYYAGHGIQVQGNNYLIPVDVGLNREGDLRRTVLLGDLLTEVNQARELGLVIFWTPAGTTRSRRGSIRARDGRWRGGVWRGWNRPAAIPWSPSPRGTTTSRRTAASTPPPW